MIKEFLKGIFFETDICFAGSCMVTIVDKDGKQHKFKAHNVLINQYGDVDTDILIHGDVDIL